MTRDAEQRAERVQVLRQADADIRRLAMAETECGKPKKLSLTGTPLTLNEPNGRVHISKDHRREADEARQQMKKQHHQKVMFGTTIAVEAQDEQSILKLVTFLSSN